MDLNTKDWKEFNIARLCHINMGNKFDNDKMTHDLPSINFVSRTANNNGISDIVDKIDGVEPYPANSITVALGGSIGSCYLQPKPFYTGQNVSVLLFDESISNNIKLFITTMFMNECKYKYVAFGRELNVHIRNDFTFYLPIKYNSDKTPFIDNTKKYSDEGYVPDWHFMEDYIKSLHHKPITTKVKTGNMPKLNLQSWQWFSMSKLFDIKKGKRLTSADQEEGSNNYVGAIDSNNGIANHIGQAPIHKANTISLSYNGSVGEAFYQSEPYWATDDVNALYSKYDGFNKQIGLFMVTVIRQEKYKFSYGRKWTLDNMNKTEIKLPIQQDDKGNPIIDNNYTYSDKGYIPDWQFMEDYINSLPYSDRIK